MFIEILFKIVLFKGGVLIYAEHCISGIVSVTCRLLEAAFKIHLAQKTVF